MSLKKGAALLDAAKGPVKNEPQARALGRADVQRPVQLAHVLDRDVVGADLSAPGEARAALVAEDGLA